MNKRLELVDALRGFAIVAIILLHHMEHFEFYYEPPHFSAWFKNFNHQLMQVGYFLFGGKAYAIFALLFGFSFQIQKQNHEILYGDYRLKFFWRMVYLLIFGLINTAFYQGDILTMYAFLSFILIITYKFSTKAILISAIILFLQPIDWIRVIYALINENYIKSEYASIAYYKQISQYMLNGNFLDYVLGNLTLGKAASLLWSYENGRFLQAPALFLLGSYLAQKKMFEVNQINIVFWKRVLLFAVICFIPLFYINIHVVNVITNNAVKLPLGVIIASLANLSFMFFWVALFVILFQVSNLKKILFQLVPLGKMGLTNYILQSIIGSTLYYKYGFSLYANTGVVHGLIIGILILILNIHFCKWWLKSNNQGPLELIWQKAVLFTLNKK